MTASRDSTKASLDVSLRETSVSDTDGIFVRLVEQFISRRNMVEVMHYAADCHMSVPSK